jgi:hypothetical protein
VMVMSVSGGSLAESIGMTQGSTIQYVAGQEVRQLEDLGDLLRANLGQATEITWTEQGGKAVTRDVVLPTTVELNRGVLGVTVTPLAPDSQMVLDRYKSAFGTNPLAILLPPTMQQGAVPYSDLMAPKYTSSVFGDAYAPIANILFWVWFINFNVGIFNALPIGPLDGGQLYGVVIENRAKSKLLARNATTLLTLTMVAIVAVVVFSPYLF